MGLKYGAHLLILFNFSQAGIHLLPPSQGVEKSSTKKVGLAVWKRCFQRHSLKNAAKSTCRPFWEVGSASDKGVRVSPEHWCLLGPSAAVLQAKQEKSHHATYGYPQAPVTPGAGFLLRSYWRDKGLVTHCKYMLATGRERLFLPAGRLMTDINLGLFLYFKYFTVLSAR